MKNDARKYLLTDFNFRSSLISLGGPVIPDRICFNKISDRDVYRAWSPAQNFCSGFLLTSLLNFSRPYYAKDNNKLFSDLENC